MTRIELTQQVLELPVAEQLELAQAVLERNTPPADFEISTELRATLRARLAEAKANPEAGLPWGEVKASILKSL